MRIASIEVVWSRSPLSPLSAYAVATSRAPVISLYRLMQFQMKHLMLLGALLLPLGSAHAQEQKIKCPGETTVEMQYCAGLSERQSIDQLKQKVPMQMLQQWQNATRSVCAHANALYKDGSIYSQLVVDCYDNLNRALLKEFRKMGN